MRLEKQRSVYVGSYRLDEESLELTFNKKPMENFKQEIIWFDFCFKKRYSGCCMTSRS